MRIIFSSLVSLLFSLSPVVAGPPKFAPPVDCWEAGSCFVQNYVDHIAATGPASDFACGHLTYDGHKGTDFRLKTLPEMRAGVTVKAAAPGIVRASRDGEPDINVRERGKTAVAGIECGNGVVIVHGDGWETQYCHLKKGSITVDPGLEVRTGTVLGEIGLSGNTEFPHLHFEIRHEGKTVDPFKPEDRTDCGPAPQTLWASAPEPYRETGLVDAGFTTAPPDLPELMAGEHRLSTLAAAEKADALIFWAQLYGGQRGDVLALTLTADGETIAENSLKLDRHKADFMAFAGRRLDPETLKGKTVAGYLKLSRPGKGEIIAQTMRLSAE